MKKNLPLIVTLIAIILTASCENKDKESEQLKDPRITFTIGDSLYQYEIQYLTNNEFNIRYLRDTINSDDSVILGYATYFGNETQNLQVSFLISKKFKVNDLENDITNLMYIDYASSTYDSYILIEPILYLPSPCEKQLILTSGNYNFIEKYSRQWTEYTQGGVRFGLYDNMGGWPEWISCIPEITTGENIGQYADLPEEFQSGSQFQINNNEEISQEEIANLNEIYFQVEYQDSDIYDIKNTLIEADFKVTLYKENGDILKLENGYLCAIF